MKYLPIFILVVSFFCKTLAITAEAVDFTNQTASSIYRLSPSSSFTWNNTLFKVVEGKMIFLKISEWGCQYLLQW